MATCGKKLVISSCWVTKRKLVVIVNDVTILVQKSEGCTVSYICKHAINNSKEWRLGDYSNFTRDPAIPSSKK
jgi:hypothetical protein